MNPSRNTPSLLLATGLALAAVTALAQSSNSTSASQDYAPAKPGNPLNSNSTGKTGDPGTAREITVEQFMAVDTDYDGRISLKEFVDSPILSGQADASSRSSASGTPRSDETNQAEAEVKGRNTPELFRRLDKNENGYLSSTEIAVYYQVDSRI